MTQPTTGALDWASFKAHRQSRIVQMWRAGKSREEIGLLVGLSAERVRGILIEAGVWTGRRAKP